MTDIRDKINQLTSDQKDEALVDLTNIAFNLAAVLRTVEILALRAVVESEEADEDPDFLQVGAALVTMRGVPGISEGVLTESAMIALSAENVERFITTNDMIADSLDYLRAWSEEEDESVTDAAYADNVEDYLNALGITHEELLDWLEALGLNV